MWPPSSFLPTTITSDLLLLPISPGLMSDQYWYLQCVRGKKDLSSLTFLPNFWGFEFLCCNTKTEQFFKKHDEKSMSTILPIYFCGYVLKCHNSYLVHIGSFRPDVQSLSVRTGKAQFLSHGKTATEETNVFWQVYGWLNGSMVKPSNFLSVYLLKEKTMLFAKHVVNWWR